MSYHDQIIQHTIIVVSVFAFISLFFLAIYLADKYVTSDIGIIMVGAIAILLLVLLFILCHEN